VYDAFLNCFHNGLQRVSKFTQLNATTLYKRAVTEQEKWSNLNSNSKGKKKATEQDDSGMFLEGKKEEAERVSLLFQCESNPWINDSLY